MSADPSLLWALNASSAASLAVLVWEWAITFDSEVDLIWSKPHTSWIKWVFLVSRYFTLAVSIIGRYLEASINIYEPPNPQSGNSSLLRVWYAGQVVMAAVVVIILEIILVARVYALYRQRFIGIVLLSCIFTELSMAIVGLVLNLPSATFNRSLIISHLPASFAYFGLCSITMQILVLILTIRKYIRSSLKTTPLVQLLLRDGTMAFLMLTVFQITVVAYTLTKTAYAVTAYAWLLAASSCTTSRIIINMEMIGTSSRSSSRNTSTVIVFTTIFTDQIAYEETIPTVSSFQDSSQSDDV